MQEVSSISCVNNAACDMEVRVKWEGNKDITGWSRPIPIDQSHTIDLRQYDMAKGDSVTLRSRSKGGYTKDCHDEVAYDPDTDNHATYTFTGTVDKFTCHLK